MGCVEAFATEALASLYLLPRRDTGKQRAAVKTSRVQRKDTTAEPAGAASTAAPATPASSPWRGLPLDFQETELGPGFPNKIDSAWTDVGVLESGDVLRIEADGFSSKDSPIAVWGWYLNVWNKDGRHWVTEKGDSEPSRFLAVQSLLIRT